MISPRDPLHDNLQPVIQSAPAIPRAGPNQGLTGRFTSMMLPSIPPVMGPGQSTQRLMSSRVPPTPTRLGMPRNATGHVNVGSISGRSPPSASVPIATTLVPPTPSSLHHPGYSGEKSAFLAPFEMFYDALADSKQLKNWLGEQLQKSQALTVSLQRQQEQLDETVSALVERKVATMREEVYGLHRRVEELEQALRATRPSQSFSPNMPGAKGKTKANGVPPAPVAPETYTFPPADHTLRRTEPSRRMLSPMQVEKDGESRSFPGSQTSSPVPFDVGRRLSVSAIRLDPALASFRNDPARVVQHAFVELHFSRARVVEPWAGAASTGRASGLVTWSTTGECTVDIGTRLAQPSAPIAFC
ncbi:hypothetical protein A0H81_11098 [Grifola frondosa]|uniref:Uncharacterized protein n=1 Tax=Grifola frondosa TaxID=5627 RepID=A0A1C7LW90_GRIFR|nr:hypothetical protein A0H81_11098 [Grifola frondosa]